MLEMFEFGFFVIHFLCLPTTYTNTPYSIFFIFSYYFLWWFFVPKKVQLIEIKMKNLLFCNKQLSLKRKYCLVPDLSEYKKYILINVSWLYIWRNVGVGKYHRFLLIKQNCYSITLLHIFKARKSFMIF